MTPDEINRFEKEHPKKVETVLQDAAISAQSKIPSRSVDMVKGRDDAVILNPKNVEQYLQKMNTKSANTEYVGQTVTQSKGATQRN